MSEKKHLALPALLRELAECLKAASGDESTQGSEAETVASRMQSLLLALVDNCTKSQRRKPLLPQNQIIVPNPLADRCPGMHKPGRLFLCGLQNRNHGNMTDKH